MKHRTPIFLAAAVLTGAILVPVAALAQKAGVSAAVRGDVELTRESQQVVGRQVDSGEDILLRDVVESGTASGMQVLLLDETVFTIGPESAIVIDEFVYDPATGSGEVTAEVVKGVFRFVTGKVAQNDPESMNVKLPVGNIGVRGTRVAGIVRPGPNVLAILLGRGENNDEGKKPGAFVAQNEGVSEWVRTPGWGAEFFPGKPPEIVKVDPKLLEQILAMLNNPQGVDWASMPEALQWLSGSPDDQSGQGVGEGRTLEILDRTLVRESQRRYDRTIDAAQSALDKQSNDSDNYDNE